MGPLKTGKKDPFFASVGTFTLYFFFLGGFLVAVFFSVFFFAIWFPLSLFYICSVLKHSASIVLIPVDGAAHKRGHMKTQHIHLTHTPCMEFLKMELGFQLPKIFHLPIPLTHHSNSADL